jgi:nucleotide-binding universal stress UspA family protein
MMNASIICGVDGSADSQAALAFAERLASRLGTRLILAHVAELAYIPYAAAAPFGGSAGRMAVAEEIDSKKEAAEHLLEEVADAAGLADAERRAAVGLPAERLADLADDEDAELIVVGSRGRGAFKTAFLGSVSNSLVGIARCPVVIVPPGAAERPVSSRIAAVKADMQLRRRSKTDEQPDHFPSTINRDEPTESPKRAASASSSDTPSQNDANIPE